MKNKVNETIFNKFAKYYDQIYYDKNYTKETQLILSILKKYSKKNEKNILDFGCGTGKHSLILAKKGFNITGIDQSSAVLEIAKQRFDENGLKGSFLQKNITNFTSQKKFDSCISLFSTFCYLEKNIDLKKALENIKKSLKPNGLLIFDFWNGHSVINEKPTTKVKIIENKNIRILRIATPKMNYKNNICIIEYHCIVIENNNIVDEFKESHKIRYHFPNDLQYFLEASGFELIEIRPMYIKDNKKNNEYLDNWYLLAITRRRR